MSQSELSVLQRISLSEISNIASFWGDLPEKAADLLGYDALQKRKKSLTTREVLNNAETRPFTKESVEKYKREITEQANPRFLLLHNVARVMFNVGMFGIILCFGPALLGWFISWKIGLAFVGGLVAFAAITTSLEGRATKYPGSWKVTPLKGYAEPVPEFVLHQAIKLKEGLPDAEFFVHQFVQNEKVLDPFLVVRHGDEEHFIAVWNEPKFEAEQKV